MATQDETIKLALAIEGQEKAEALRKQMAALRESIISVGAAHGATSPQVLALAGQFHAAQTQAAELDRQFGRASASGANFGRSVLLASQGVEDLQYGFSAVLNNIPNLLQSLGAGAGLAGVVSLVGVGAAVLSRHWGEVTEALGGSHVKTATEEMNELGKATERTADAEARYQKLKQAARESAESAAAGKKLEEGRHPLNEEAAKRVAQAIDGQTDPDGKTGHAKILAGLKSDSELVRSKMTTEEHETTDANNAKIARDRAKLDDPLTPMQGRRIALSNIKILSDANEAIYQKAVYGEVDKAGKEVDRPSVKRMLSDPAAMGKTENIKALSGAIAGDRDRMKAEGVDVDAVTAKLDASLPANIKAEKAKAEGRAHTAILEEFNAAQLKSDQEAHRKQVEEGQSHTRILDDMNTHELQAVKESNAKAIAAKKKLADEKKHKADQVKALADHEAKQAENEAKRIAGATDIDEEAITTMTRGAQLRAMANSMSGADRRLFIARARAAGHPINTEAEDNAAAEARINARLRGAVDANGQPLANTQGIAGAMMQDIRGARGLGMIRNPAVSRAMAPPMRTRPGADGKDGAGNPNQEKQLKEANSALEEINRTLKQGVKLQLGP